MKNLTFFITFLLCGWVIFASEDFQVKDPLKDQLKDQFSWNFLWLGSWEESVSTQLRGILNNSVEFNLDILPIDLTLRTQILDRRPLTFENDSFEWNEIWGDPEKWITNYTLGLYHNTTGSRLLYGVLDESGLPARIRNPWLRSPAYPENHKPVSADLKTAASSTKEDEVYLYISSPFFELSPNIKLRGFFSAQTEVEAFTPALCAGLDFALTNKTNLLLDVFYTGETLSPTKNNTWFSDPPPLPQRDFNLYAAGFLFSNPAFSISSDFALSDTFAWGMDIYVNLGFSFSPLLPVGTRARPLLVSFAADGSGERFVNRDGVILKEGFRSAVKVEWKERYNALLRFDTVLRSPGINEDFNRSSTGFYCRFPSPARSRNDFFRFTRISLSAERNAENNQKITDIYSGTLAFRLNLKQIGIENFFTEKPFGITFSGSIKGLSASENPSFYPIFDTPVSWVSNSLGCEISWSPWILQVRSKIGFTSFAEKDGKWDYSINVSARMNKGRLSVKASSGDFPEKWNFSASWRLEIY
ncbi:MAG: hypothetical protein FWD47_07675 [Treponema sp.]|nr:hypothetical protein [Treponema sp.]